MHDAFGLAFHAYDGQPDVVQRTAQTDEAQADLLDAADGAQADCRRARAELAFAGTLIHNDRAILSGDSELSSYRTEAESNTTSCA